MRCSPLPPPTLITSHVSTRAYLRDIISSRQLFYFLTWRELIVRYRQTALGVVWAIVRPLLPMVVFLFVFGRLAPLKIQGSYPLFILAGAVPWTLFSSSLVDTSQSLINHIPMISKVYFPRVILPLSQIAIQGVDFSIGLSSFLLVAGLSGELCHLSLFVLPFIILLQLALCVGVGFWLSALTVRYRDVRFIVPFLVQFGVFLSPVGYDGFFLASQWGWIYYLNPMVGIIEGFRWSCLGYWHTDLPLALFLSLIVTGILLMTGFRRFRHIEHICADII